MFLPLLLPLLLQITPVAPLPKGTALPPPGTAEAAPMATLTRLLAALDAGDVAAMRAEIRADGGVTAALERPDGTRAVRHLSWNAFLAGIAPDAARHEERLIDPAIEVDGDIAMVWSPYVQLADGKLDHCGTDHADLVREDGRWKVVNLSWTQRTTGCPAQ